MDGTPVDIDAIGVPMDITTFANDDAIHYFAVRVDMPQQFEQTAWGDMLCDYLICSATKGDDGTWKPNLDYRWIVNGAVFKDTYVLC
jgi:hypothetical protein